MATEKPSNRCGSRVFLGDPAGIRTPDPLLKRQLLCRLSYRVVVGRDPASQIPPFRRVPFRFDPSAPPHEICRSWGGHCARLRWTGSALPSPVLSSPAKAGTARGEGRAPWRSGGSSRPAGASPSGGDGAAWGPSGLAGTAGLEPAHEGVKVPCLTAWLRPRVLE